MPGTERRSLRDRFARARRWIGRAAGWSLFPLLLLQFLSGYAILHGRVLGGVLSKPSAFKLHRAVQPITLIAFVLHGFPWIRRALARRGVRHRLFDALLVSAGAALIAFSLYLHSRG